MSDLHRPAHVCSVLIWGGWYGSRNIGDTAILLGLKELIALANQGRDVYVRVLSTDADYTSSQGVTGEKALVKSELLRPWAWLRVLRIFARPDRVIVSGGTPIFDSSHAIRTLYLSLPLLFRTPTVVFGAGAKPLRSWYGRRSVPLLLRRACYISVRDEDSRRILEDLGVEGVELTADSAFFARPAPAHAVDEIVGACGIAPDESLLVVCPRLLSGERKRLYLQERMDATLIAETPPKLAAAIDRLAGRFDRVVLMAMHFHGPDSDVPLIRDVLGRVRSRNVVFVERELRAEQAIALFRRARLVLGVRLHALLLAASMGTPMVGIAYEQKVRGLFERLGLADYCLDLFHLEVEPLVAAAERALECEAAIRPHLERRVGQLRALVIESARNALRMDATPKRRAGPGAT
jgi:polysaccharide pyruvyl transferase WcaK-like protein